MTWAPGVSSAVLDAADEFIAELRQRHIEGSLATAKRTAEILRLVITKSRHAMPDALLDDVRTVGTRLQAAKPLGEDTAMFCFLRDGSRTGYLIGISSCIKPIGRCPQCGLEWLQH